MLATLTIATSVLIVVVVCATVAFEVIAINWVMDKIEEYVKKEN